MKQPILVTYRSVTGFTQQYAQWIAEALGGACRPLADLSKDDMAAYGTVIFGGRFHAGSVDGLKQAKALAAACQVPRFLVFATGATPAAAQDQIAAAWAANLTPEEAAHIPHFYFPGGLRYEAMPLGDKLMMKAFSAMIRRKKNKTPDEQAMAEAITASYDLSAREHIAPLVDCVTGME